MIGRDGRTGPKSSAPPARRLHKAHVINSESDGLRDLEACSRALETSGLRVQRRPADGIHGLAASLTDAGTAIENSAPRGLRPAAAATNPGIVPSFATAAVGRG